VGSDVLRQRRAGASLLPLVLLALNGCKEVGSEEGHVCRSQIPTSCPSPAPTYEKDVAPILKQRCYSCHDGTGVQWPLTEYDHVADWQDQIRAMMLTCSMPPLDAGIDMPNEERDVILAWIRCNVPEK
jgi:hypothetical protein